MDQFGDYMEMFDPDWIVPSSNDEALCDTPFDL